MIFVHTSTGNSLQFAEDLASCIGDSVTRISDIGEGKVDVRGVDTVGFVTPVYFFNLPRIVRRFLDRIEFSEGQRFFLVFTYGTLPDRACRVARRHFRRRGMNLTHVFAFRMPENYVALFDPPEESEIELMLDRVHSDVEVVVSSLREREGCTVSDRIGLLGLLTLFGDFAYDRMRGTKGFHTDGRCNGCGLCSRICPSGCIGMQDGAPVWHMKKCEHCMGCVNRCPKGSIQYKGRTVRRRRYVNPRVRL